MSSLTADYLRPMREQYSLTAFVETGCYRGDGIAAALEAGFDQVWSSDIAPEHARLSVDRFPGDERIHIEIGPSTDALRRHLPLIRGTVLFWLDGHFPAHYGLDQYEDRLTKFPLAEELRLIAELRPGGRDVILADDMRVIDASDNPRWCDGEVSEYYRIQATVAELTQPLAATHLIRIDLQQEGILILTPKP